MKLIPITIVFLNTEVPNAIVLMQAVPSKGSNLQFSVFNHLNNGQHLQVTAWNVFSIDHNINSSSEEISIFVYVNAIS